MAPLARTLALLAMAVATAAEEIYMDMADNSFDDQYLTCSIEMFKKFPELQSSDFRKNVQLEKNWTNAEKEWKKLRSDPSPLTSHEAVALMVYSMKKTNLYLEFNKAVRTAGSSSWEYQDKFHFKSLHFLLTHAVQTLEPDECLYVFRGVKDEFKATPGQEVRFSQFTSTSRSEKVAQDYGQVTMFKVITCYGADIQKFSYNKSEQEVLIPPFETFNVTRVREKEKTIELESTGTFSNYDCVWLEGDNMGTTWEDWDTQRGLGTRTHSAGDTHGPERIETPTAGGSLPRNSPHLGGLLLATVTMAMATGTL